MARAAEKKIYRMSAFCAFATALAFIVPRFVPNREGGFASATTAILDVSRPRISAAGMPLQSVSDGPSAPRARWPRLAGIAPSVILVGAVVFLLALLRY